MRLVEANKSYQSNGNTVKKAPGGYYAPGMKQYTPNRESNNQGRSGSDNND